jgi:hypothetical protein
LSAVFAGLFANLGVQNAVFCVVNVVELCGWKRQQKAGGKWDSILCFSHVYFRTSIRIDPIRAL